MKITEYKALRESLNLTQQIVADAIKCHMRTISKIERGLANDNSRTMQAYKEYILNKIK